MLARMQNGLRSIGRQIHDSRSSWASRLNSEERTQRTWARVIESYDHLPNVYREFFEPHRASGRAFPYTVFTPGFETLGYRITAKLVSVFDHELVFLEESAKGLAAQIYPLDGISFVEMSSMLLDSRFKVQGVTHRGIQTSSTVRFSTATDYVLTPVLRMVRLHAAGLKETAQDADPKTFEEWLTLDFKFMNLARRSLLGGENVLHAILQPEIRVRRFRILGRTYYKTICPTHVSILTERELILIREEVLENRDDKYGGIWVYLPLDKIESVSMNRKNGGLLALSIQILSGECFEALFQASMETEIDRFLEQFRGLKSR